MCSVLSDNYYYPIDNELMESLDLIKGVANNKDYSDYQKIKATITQHIKTYNLKFFSGVGGSCCNTLRCLSVLGRSVFLASCIGVDDNSVTIKECLNQAKVKYNLRVVDGHSGSVEVMVSSDGDRTMISDLAANLHISEHDLPAAHIINSKIFHLCGYHWLSSKHRGASLDGIYIARSSKAIVSFDLADPLVVKSFKDDFVKLINKGKVDLVFANEGEITELMGGDYLSKITDLDSSIIWIIKLGARGAKVIKKDQCIDIKPIKTDVIDTTGAGDLFASGFLYGILKNLPLKICGDLGSILASDVISRLGTNSSDLVIKKCKDLANNS